MAPECRVRCLRGLQQDPVLSVSGSMPVLLAQRTLPPCLVRSSAAHCLKTCLPLDEVLSARVRLRPSVPQGAWDLWGSCLNAALGGIIAHRDSRAWIDFLLLPSLAGSWWFQSHATLHQRDETYWLSAVRLELWDLPQKSSSSRAPTDKPPASSEPSFDLDERTAVRVHTLISEGALRRACTALTADPPVPLTPEVVDELRLLHPGPDLVRRALATIAPPLVPGPAVFVLHIFRMLCATLLVTRH